MLKTEIVENDDTLWPPLTKGKGRKEKKKLTKKSLLHKLEMNTVIHLYVTLLW